MSAFIVNGEQRHLPIDETQLVHELISHLRKNWTSETSLISAIRVNGKELSSQDEARLGDIPVSKIDSIEVFTAHPKEVAEETLQMMIVFLEGLENLSRMASSKQGTQEGDVKFYRLIEGLGTFSEAYDTVKRILRLAEDPRHQTTQQMELEFVGLLREMLAAKEKGDRTALSSLLADRLPVNLAQWRTERLPDIIRSRDS